MEARVQI